MMKIFLSLGLCFFFSPFLNADPGGINPPPDVPTTNGAQTAPAIWTRIGSEGQEVMAQLQKHDPSVAKLIPTLKGDLSLYLANFPNDLHVPEGKMMLAQVNDLERGLQLPGAPTAQAVNQEFGALAADTSLPLQLRAEASLMTVTTALRDARAGDTTQAADSTDHSARWDHVDAKISDFEKNFGTVSFDGKASAAVMLREEQVKLLQQAGETARLNALLVKLASDPHPEIAAMAKQAATDAKSRADLKSTPLDLKFTAVDGSAVDLAQMRGKVVLIDFWATWCPPCREEVPDVVAAYQKYHSQGFEIVGISLDQDKEALQAFVKEKGMTWPQYFDGKGWDNAISSRFGIQSVPAMWLIGKDGILVTQEGRDDLAGQVQKLLSAK